jgi:hypothetical protein
MMLNNDIKYRVNFAVLCKKEVRFTNIMRSIIQGQLTNIYEASHMEHEIEYA